MANASHTFFDWTRLAQKILLEVIQNLVIDDAHKNVFLYAMKNYRRTSSIRKGWNDLKRQNCFARTEPGLKFFLKKQNTRRQQESWDCLESTYIGYNSFSSSDNSESNLQIQLFNVNVEVLNKYTKQFSEKHWRHLRLNVKRYSAPSSCMIPF